MLIEEIKNFFRGEVSTDEETLQKYSEDYSIFQVKPQIVVFPADTEDLRGLVKFATKKKEAGEDISLTGRSAGTDMSGGPLNESIIVEFASHFNHIKEIADQYAMVEPGVYFRDFEKELASRGLMYPAFPASKDLCALGGMVMNNSGGEKTLIYGKTENYVEELKMVLADGEEHSFRSLNESELGDKRQETGYAGEIYRKLFKLIDDNYEIIKNAKPKVSKNSAGYSLWNVWDKKTFDITKLMVGSQGTLGLLTAAKLRLVRVNKYSKLIVIFSKTLEPIPNLVEKILPFGPESIESYDDKTLKLALRFFPALLKLMKGSAPKLFWKFFPEALMILRGGIPKMILLVSVASDSEEDLEKRTLAIAAAAKKFPVLTRVVRNGAEAEEFWTIRRQSFNLLHSHVKGMEAAPFIDDIIVEPKYMAEFLPQVNSILDAHKEKLIYTIAGHPGNGNFHIIPLVKLDDPEVLRLIPQITEQVYRLVLKYGGSITAEHNDGLIRTPYLKQMYGERITELFREVKNIFDPLNIFNPGKKVGVSLDYSLKHIKSGRGL